MDTHWIEQSTQDTSIIHCKFGQTVAQASRDKHIFAGANGLRLISLSPLRKARHLDRETDVVANGGRAVEADLVRNVGRWWI